MNSFLDLSFALRLTESLLHFLWQGALIGGMACLALRSMRRFAASTRYAVSTGALLALALCVPATFLLVESRIEEEPAITFSPPALLEETPNPVEEVSLTDLAMPVEFRLAPMESFPSSQGMAAPFKMPAPADSDEPAIAISPATPVPAPTPPARWRVWLQRSAPSVAGAYFLGVMMMIVRLALALWGGHRLRRDAQPIRDRDLLLQIRRQATQIGLKTAPVVAYCGRCVTPVVTGVIRPMILLPVWISTGLDARQFQAILAHEMAHIRRFDLLVNILQRMIETMLFFHPAVWYVSRQVSLERENCCDDMVVTAGYGHLQYADALVRMAELASSHLAPAVSGRFATLAATGDNHSQLKRRVLRLLGPDRALKLTRVDLLTLVLVLALLFGAGVGAWSQNSSPDEADDIAAVENQEIENSDTSPDDDAESADTEDEPVAVHDSTTTEDMTDDTDDGKPRLINRELTFVDSSGRPVAGVEVVLVRSHRHFSHISAREVLGASDEAGNLNVALPDGGWDFHEPISTAAYAHAAGNRIVRVPLQQSGPKSLLERVKNLLTPDSWNRIVVPDEPPLLRGRLVSIDGRPLSGVRVSFRREELLTDTQSGSDPLHESSPDKVTERVRRLQDMIVRDRLRDVLPSTTTNAKGWFEIPLPDHAIAELLAERDDLESTLIWVRNTEGGTQQIPPRPNFSEQERTLHGPEFTAILQPSAPVTGQVVSAETGEPIPDAVIRVCMVPHINFISFKQYDYLQTKTDESGRYRLTGIPLGKDAQLTATATGDQPYVSVGDKVTIQLDTNSQPIVQDFKLPLGIWANVQALDAETQEPLFGYVQYFLFQEDEAIERYPGIRHHFIEHGVPTNREGKARISVLPVRAILGFSHLPIAKDLNRRKELSQRYPRGAGAESISGMENGLFRTIPHSLYKTNLNRMVEIHPAEGEQELDVNLDLQAPPAVRIQVVDEQDAPVRTVYRHLEMSRWEQSNDGIHEVRGLRSDEQRNVFFIEPDRNLAGAMKVSLADPGPHKVTLRPAGRITGRLVDESGEPLNDVVIFSLSDEKVDSGHWGFKLSGPQPTTLKTDADGRFELIGLLPGWKYDAGILDPFKNRPSFVTDYLFQNLSIDGPEDCDLGEVRLDRDGKIVSKIALSETKAGDGGGSVASEASLPVEADGEVTAEATTDDADADEFLQVAGTVVDPKGAPVAGAMVHVNLTQRGEFYASPHTTVPLARLTSDAHGRFETRIRKDLFPNPPPAKWNGPHLGVNVIAFHDGSGFAIEQVHPVDGLMSNELRLRPDVPVNGRLLDINGQPVAGARIDVYGIWQSTPDKVDEWLRQVANSKIKALGFGIVNLQPVTPHFPYVNTMLISPAELPQAVTDAEGRFTLHGLGKDRLANLRVSGDSIATSLVSVLCRPISAIQATSPTRAMRTSVIYGSELEYVASPGFTVEGTLKDLETGAPIAHALVMSHSIAGSTFNSTGFLSTSTDEQGRYRIQGIPPNQPHSKEWGAQNRLFVFAKDRAYLPTDSFQIPHAAEQSVIPFDIALRKAVWVTGIVSERETGKPVKGRLAYTPMIRNEFNQNYPQYADNSRMIVGNDDYFRTDENGRYRMPVIPGAGVVAFHADEPIYRNHIGLEGIPELATKESRTIAGSATSDHLLLEVYFHVLSRIEPKSTDEEIELNLHVESSPPFLVTFVDPAGRPIPGDLKVDIGQGVTHSAVADSKVYVQGLAPKTPKFIRAISEASQLGIATEFVMQPGETERTLTLQPLVTITGRLITQDDEPIGHLSGPMMQRTEAGSMTVVGGFNSDSEGRFEATTPALKSFTLSTNGGGFHHLATIDSAQPGERIDLGDLEIDLETLASPAVPRRAPIRTLMTAAATSPAEATASD